MQMSPRFIAWDAGFELFARFSVGQVDVNVIGRDRLRRCDRRGVASRLGEQDVIPEPQTHRMADDDE